jgi:hypothetical protein
MCAHPKRAAERSFEKEHGGPMTLFLSPQQALAIRRDFARVVNMDPLDLEAWLETEESRKVGFFRRGESESVGRQSGRRILEILRTAAEDLSDADYAHMKKVIGYARRHLAQRPWGDVTHTRWRWSLMNWGHDPLIGRRAEG